MFTFYYSSYESIKLTLNTLLYEKFDEHIFSIADQKFRIKQFQIDSTKIKGEITFYDCADIRKIRLDLIPLTTSGQDLCKSLHSNLERIDFILPPYVPIWAIHFYDGYIFSNHEVKCESGKITFNKLVSVTPVEFIVEDDLVEISSPDEYVEDCSEDFVMLNYEYHNQKNQLKTEYIQYNAEDNLDKLFSTICGGRNFKLDENRIDFLQQYSKSFLKRDKDGTILPPTDWKHTYDFFSSFGNCKRFGGIMDFTQLYLYLPSFCGVRLGDANVDVMHYYNKMNEYNKGKNRINNLYIIWRAYKHEKNELYHWVPMKLSAKKIKDLDRIWEEVFKDEIEKDKFKST